MSFFKKVYNVLSDKRDITEPIIYKDFNPKSTMIHTLTSLAEGTDSNIDKKKVEQHLKLFSIGQTGESSVMFELKNSLLPILILHDVNIEYEDYKAQLDFVLVTHKFILVLEVKKLFGNIKVTEKGEFQRVITKNNRTINKEGMYSPINQVERHVAILEKLLKSKNIINKCPIRYAITFANPKTIIDISKKAPVHIQSSVIRHDQIKAFLTSELKKDSPVFMRDDIVLNIAEAIKVSCREKEFDKSQYLIDNIVREEPVVVEENNLTSTPDKNDLKYVLINYRSKKAKQQECAPYHVFTNKTLDEIVEKLPSTIDQLLKIQGIGNQKAEMYGYDILAFIKKSTEDKQTPPTVVSNNPTDLKKSLMEFRSKRARELNAKPYYIFTNKTLDAIVEIKPKTLDELLKVEGIGAKKADEFGEEILRLVNK